MKRVRGLATSAISLFLVVGCGAATTDTVAQSASGSTSASTDGVPLQSTVVVEGPTLAPLSLALGEKADYSVLLARVISEPSVFYGGSGRGQGASDPRAGDSIYTSFGVFEVRFLRGKAFKVDSLAFEGGAIGANFVTIDGGPLLPDNGSLLYAVVPAGKADRLRPGLVEVGSLFPAIGNDEVFMRESIVLDEAFQDGSVQPTPRDAYGNVAKTVKGRKVGKGAFEKAVREAS